MHQRKVGVMDETFIININCSSILFDSSETHYTMLVDTIKISIVYELVEWIRWIFSVENCIYLTHENSVIHELEDIRILSKLKDIEVKICGKSFCTHNKPYRNFLNQNLFVNWNDMKVPKYFLEKLNKINEKLVQEKITGDYVKPTSCFLKESKHVYSNRISVEKSCDIQLSDSNCNGHPFTKRSLIDDSKSDLAPVCDSSFEINCFDNKKKEKNLLINFEESSDGSNNSFNSNNTKIKNYGGDGLVESHADSKETKNPGSSKNNTIFSSYKNPKKFVKPFSLGEILSNIREDFKKQNMKSTLDKSTLLDDSNVQENFINKSPEKLIGNETVKGKKRQRTRKRKTKKQEVENKHLILPTSQRRNFIEKFNIYNGKNIKPNHIRFEEEDEVQLMETDCVGDESETKIQNEFETDHKINELVSFVKPETTKFIEDDQNFSNQIVISPLESKIKNQTVGDEDKVINSDDGGCVDDFQSFNAGESCETPTFAQDLNMIESLKEKLKTVVVNRFY